ncbi:MAG: hypothetical protein HUJ71_03750, partial [Pseudobutyrivibrio sp.]|nr:hypothetical protein [Pseudobutyrivibrio sp.]
FGNAEQGVFEANLAHNKQRLTESFTKEAQEFAQNYVKNNDAGKAAVQAEYENLLEETQRAGLEVGPIEKANLRLQAERNVAENFTRTYYDDKVNSLEGINKQAQAIGIAGDAATVDYYGEALKYSLVNLFGHMNWMFRNRNTPTTQAMLEEEALLGKGLSNTKTATAQDIERFGKLRTKYTEQMNKAIEKAGDDADKIAKIKAKYETKLESLPTEVGQRYVPTWSNMTKAQKANRVLATTGSQLFGGAWTNYTDELQSGGAKEQNDVLFDAYLDNGDADGMYAFVNTIAAQLAGIVRVADDENSMIAGEVGGLGSVFGIGLNPVGFMASMATKQGRADFARMNNLEKLNSIIQNGIISEVFDKVHTEEAANSLIQKALKMREDIDKDKMSVIETLASLGKIDKPSVSQQESLEKDVSHLFNILSAIETFKMTTPQLFETMGESLRQQYTDEIANLKDFDNLTDEQKSAY